MRTHTPSGVRRGPKCAWQRLAPAAPPKPTPAPQTQRRNLAQLQERVALGDIADITPAEWVLIERARKRDKFAPLIEAAKQEFDAQQAVIPKRGRPKKSATTTGAARARRQS